jgi:hypothetical protein
VVTPVRSPMVSFHSFAHVPSASIFFSHAFTNGVASEPFGRPMPYGILAAEATRRRP